MAIQLMAKHRWHEQIDACLLAETERQLDLFPAHESRMRAQEWGAYTDLKPASWLVTLKSSTLWMWGLSFFGLASFLAAALSIISPNFFSP